MPARNSFVAALFLLSVCAAAAGAKVNADADDAKTPDRPISRSERKVRNLRAREQKRRLRRGLSAGAVSPLISFEYDEGTSVSYEYESSSAATLANTTLAIGDNNATKTETPALRAGTGTNSNINSNLHASDSYTFVPDP